MASSEAENKHNNIKKIDDDTKNSGHVSCGGMLGIEIPFDHLYELNTKLQSGSFGTIWVTQHRLTEKDFSATLLFLYT